MDGPVTVIIITIIVIINFSQKDRGHTKGKPVLGAPPYTHTYIHIQLRRQNTKKQAKTINKYTYTHTWNLSNYKHIIKKYYTHTYIHT